MLLKISVQFALNYFFRSRKGPDDKVPLTTSDALDTVDYGARDNPRHAELIWKKEMFGNDLATSRIT